MNYMICIPSPRLVSREYCERIHNILARMSDQYRVNIVPEPVKMRQGSCPDFYKKYRIYKDIKDRDGNGRGISDLRGREHDLKCLQKSGGSGAHEELHLRIPVSDDAGPQELPGR